MKNELKDIQLLMNAGSLTGATVSHQPMFGGWVATFQGKKKNEHYQLHTQRGEMRTFKTADAAIKLVKGLGFANCTVDFT
ncbi:hypothetical protein [Vibrio sp. 10N]|uniref:hypothetical protein n=1 Tax=Vibrio sp. 10N TaxID=3058938 RepID=UPI0028134D09|nr:hypothetical protein VB10N_47100 [Vibrio sp. 10N]